MTIGINNYKDKLNSLKQEAIEQQKEYINVSAKELFDSVGKGKGTMYSCCKAIKDELLEGDKILNDPPNPSGYSSQLKVRYDVRNMNQRKSFFHPVKRGRTGRTLTKQDIKNRLDTFLREGDFNYTFNEKSFNFSIDIKEGRIIIYIIDTFKSDHQFKIFLFDLLAECDEADIRMISLVFRNKKNGIRFMKSIPAKVRESYHISLLSIYDDLNSYFKLNT